MAKLRQVTMDIVRFSVGRKIRYGSLDGDIVHAFRGNPYMLLTGKGSSFKSEGVIYHLNDVKLLAPCLPTKIVGVGLNYHSYAVEVKAQPPSEPLIFFKPSTTVTGTESKIVLPRGSKLVGFEGELGVVIGKITKNVPSNRANQYILGYTCVNDISERYYQKKDIQWTRAKGFDTFTPVGPCIATGISPDSLKLETYVNGNLRQSASTAELLFKIPEIISYISSVMTLMPGDVIATGTPAGAGQLNAGDVVEVRIEKIGTLRNFAVDQD
jgi:2-keto-4-pentenoate hydratase/2-oxohepta-3-ene-1,7-dioic acid hydratase in catechol pathway